MYQEIIIIIVFLAGLIFCITGKQRKIKEGFLMRENCPNLLLQSGNKILLYNKNKANIPGVNPIRFNNLDEYVEFMEWQRHVGIRCPVLYLQQTYDAQNNLGWRMLNSPINPNGGRLVGLPPSQMIRETLLYDANRLDPPYNQGDYPGFDSMNQYIGDYTPLDKMFHQPGISDNPMDDNYLPPGFIQQGSYLRNRGIPQIQPNYTNQKNYQFDNFNQYDALRDREQYDKQQNQSNGTQNQSNGTQNQSNGTQNQSNGTQNQSNGTQYNIAPQYSSMAQYVPARTNPANTYAEGDSNEQKEQHYSSMDQYIQSQGDATIAQSQYSNNKVNHQNTQPR